LQDKLNSDYETRLKQLEKKSTKNMPARKDTVTKFIENLNIGNEWTHIFDKDKMESRVDDFQFQLQALKEKMPAALMK